MAHTKRARDVDKGDRLICNGQEKVVLWRITEGQQYKFFLAAGGIAVADFDDRLEVPD